MNRGVAQAIMLQRIVDHLAAQTATGTNRLGATVRAALPQRRDPIAIDKDFGQRMGVNQL